MDKEIVLLIEDHEADRKMVTTALEKEGYRVEAVTTGEQGLETLAQQRPNLVLLDLMLPGMDGLEVCRQIRGKSDLPIIMISGKDDEVDKVVGLELGADDYITKPYSTRELIARIRAVLRRGADADDARGERRDVLAEHDVWAGEAVEHAVGDAVLGTQVDLHRIARGRRRAVLAALQIEPADAKAPRTERAARQHVDLPDELRDERRARALVHVQRGADLLDSTPRQQCLLRCLGWPEPRYAHLPVATNAAGDALGIKDFKDITIKMKRIYFHFILCIYSSNQNKR